MSEIEDGTEGEEEGEGGWTYTERLVKVVERHVVQGERGLDEGDT